MLQLTSQPSFTDKQWKLLNQEEAEHALGAEILHSIYQQHWTPLTSLFLKNTVVEYKNGVMLSYVLEDELDFIAQRVGEHILENYPKIAKPIRRMMNPSYKETRKLNAKIKHTDLSKLTNSQLSALLIDSLHVPINDIYKLHLVQLEYALKYAISKCLESYEPNLKKRSKLQTQLENEFERYISKDEIAFNKIVAYGKRNSITRPSESKTMTSLLARHLRTFAQGQSEYARREPDINDYVARYRKLYASFKTQNDNSKHASISGITDKRLRELCYLMCQIKPFRSRNKAMLGSTHRYRLSIVDEIASRSNVDREDLKYYLSSEMCRLLDDAVALSKNEIKQRQENGITLIRHEGGFVGSKHYTESRKK